ncbi:MAG: efflux RND transporter periplasmic adaptor subunit, partial [Anaerolineales bacterium]|nr:efflux RND transporter periplasmic adaptor subunit [Anaerolineales bacterium]
QGDVLARMEDNLQAEGDFQALFTPAGVTQVELAAVNAQEALDDAIDNLKYTIGSDTYYWEEQLAQAEATLSAASAEQKAEAQKAVDQTLRKRDYSLELNLDYLEKEDNWRPDASDIALSRTNLENAKVALQDAEAALEIVKAGPSALQSPLTSLGKEMARLEGIRQKVENTRLTSPADSVVTTLLFQVGEYANPGVPVVALSDLNTLEAEVNLDETDVSRIQVGMPVIVSVDAFLGQELSGQVTEISLSANVQSGVVLYPVTVRVDAIPSTGSGQALPLRSGMTINVSFPIEERTDTLIVPFRAVETEGGQAYLTRVTASGSERVAVTMGLITDTQVEILSGIEAGDVVTVYANPVQDTELMNSPMFGGGQ